MQLTMQAERDASASITGNWSVWCGYYFPPLYLPRINLTFSIREYGTWSIIGDTTGRLYDRLKDKSRTRETNPLSLFFFFYTREVWFASPHGDLYENKGARYRSVRERLRKFPFQVRTQTSWTRSINSHITSPPWFIVVAPHASRCDIAVVTHETDCQNNSLNSIAPSERLVIFRTLFFTLAHTRSLFLSSKMRKCAIKF